MFLRRALILIFAGSLGVECSAGDVPPLPQQFIEANCLDCHDGTTHEAGLSLAALVGANTAEHQQAWENVVQKLASRQMPPMDAPRPTEKDYDAAITALEMVLDADAAAHLHPGRTEPLRRLNRTEYQNVIRDLLSLDVDASSLLPADESSQGFDNITVVDLSPTLLNRYVSAAQTISRQALGRTSAAPSEDAFRVRPDVTQDSHVEGLPLGTRGGALVSYNFPQDGEYEIQVRLMRDRNENVEGLAERHELEVLIDRERVRSFTVEPPPEGASDQTLDAEFNAPVTVKAGPHQVGATFLAQPASLLETTRQPLNVHFNFYRHPRIGPAVYQVSILGPLQATGSGDTPSRRRLLIAPPSRPEEEEDCAKRILENLVRRAYRRPIGAADLNAPMDFFRQGRDKGGFEAGIEAALASVLVSPNFLFRVEREPAGLPSGVAYTIDSVELASRLSFFLWSSMPDDELLDLAASGELRKPEVLRSQVQRMLGDDRSHSLATSFAEQWLHLRNLEAASPDMRLFPDFDDNLRQAMRTETELFFENVVREDRSVLDLISADYTFLNERLARHYEIPHVYGSRFRRVELDREAHRGGLLRQGSILTVTSYATRRSPVLRGQWVLKNLLGSPPPPPPPDVPELKDNTVSSDLSVRERLAQHRADPACARCHDLMDPIGFALENYDAVGRWREMEMAKPIDASATLPYCGDFEGPSGLERALLARPDLFVKTFTEKLMTFALGRGVEYYDAPAIRKIVRTAKVEDYRVSEIILGIVESTPFQMRMSR